MIILLFSLVALLGVMVYADRKGDMEMYTNAYGLSMLVVLIGVILIPFGVY